jgi:predicted O-linked N-acetylglucosamine transferase (SPINDLY family)
VTPLPDTAAPPADAAPRPLDRLELPELIERAQRLSAAGHAEATAALYAQWIESTDSPLRHIACFNWGTVLTALGRPAEAEAAYRQALAFAPAFAPARLNLGHELERRGARDEALAEWEQVARQQVTDSSREGVLHALKNRARLLETHKRYREAEAEMVRSLEIEPAQPDVLQHYVHIRQKQCEWPVYRAVGQVTPNQMLIGTSALAMLAAHDDPALQLMSARHFVSERVPRVAGDALHRTGPRRQGRLRVGYLSGDLHLHAVGLLTAEVYGLHDRSRVEVHGFCWSRDDGSTTRARIVAGLDQLHRIGSLDDAAAARLIAAQGIDVLVDLQGLTNGARPGILVRRPAPVQVSWLGLPGTCALPGVDWIVADPFVMPPELEPFHTERPLRLPNCYQPCDRQREVAPPPRRADYGLPEHGFVYCSFNNNHKFTAKVFDSWMKVLREVPDSVLWLLADNDGARDNLLREAQARGVAAERLVFAPRVLPPEYLARFALADLVLDTFPYNAGTTASDALWMGTPILTRAGRSYISRMAGSLLHAVGLPDLVTDTPEAYERLAIQIGRHPARAASYRRYLLGEGRSSALFDVPGLVRDLDDAFERVALPLRTASA